MTCVDLSGNKVGPEGARSVAQLLQENNNIVSMVKALLFIRIHEHCFHGNRSHNDSNSFKDDVNNHTGENRN